MNALPSTIRPERHAAIVTALEQFEEGKSLRDIAQVLGISHRTLRVWLLDEVPDEYKPAQRRAMLARIAEADERLENASDHVSVARAREAAKFTRWDAEHRLPQLFAVRHEVSGPGGGPIELTDLDRARRFAFLQTVIDVAPQHDDAPAAQISAAEPQPVVSEGSIPSP